MNIFMMPLSSFNGVQVNVQGKSDEQRSKIPKPLELPDFKSLSINFSLPTPKSFSSETSNSVYDDPIFYNFSGLNDSGDFSSNDSTFGDQSDHTTSLRLPRTNSHMRASTPNDNSSYNNYMHGGNMIDIRIDGVDLSALNSFDDNTTGSELCDSSAGSEAGSPFSSLALPAMPLAFCGDLNKPSQNKSFSAECLLSSNAHNACVATASSSNTGPPTRSRSWDSSLAYRERSDESQGSSNNRGRQSEPYISSPRSRGLALKCTAIGCKYNGSFQSVDYLKRHIREQHTDKTKHICHGVDGNGQSWGCKKVFKRPYQLVNHWKGPRSLHMCNVPNQKLRDCDINKRALLDADRRKKMARRQRKQSSH